MDVVAKRILAFQLNLSKQIYVKDTQLIERTERMRRAPLVFGFVFIIVGLVVAVIGFTGLFLGATVPQFEIAGVVMIFGGLVVAVQGAVAKNSQLPEKS